MFFSDMMILKQIYSFGLVETANNKTDGSNSKKP